jgi:hypothetical protein
MKYSVEGIKTADMFIITSGPVILLNLFHM